MELGEQHIRAYTKMMGRINGFQKAVSVRNSLSARRIVYRDLKPENVASSDCFTSHFCLFFKSQIFKSDQLHSNFVFVPGHLPSFFVTQTAPARCFSGRPPPRGDAGRTGLRQALRHGLRTLRNPQDQHVGRHARVHGARGSEWPAGMKKNEENTFKRDLFFGSTFIWWFKHFSRSFFWAQYFGPSIL